MKLQVVREKFIKRSTNGEKRNAYRILENQKKVNTGKTKT
jgi:hypothetical protein